MNKNKNLSWIALLFMFMTTLFVTTGCGAGADVVCEYLGGCDTDSDGGDYDEPDDENVPNYPVCRARAAPFDINLIFEEYAAYAPVVSSTIGPIETQLPWHKGLTNVTGLTGEEGVRSGLIGNFAVYNSLTLPDIHPRPPIMYHLLVKILNSHYLFRYNAYGEPCCTMIPTPDEYPDSYLGKDTDCATIPLTRTTVEIFGYPRWDGNDDYHAIWAANHAICLSNDGSFNFASAASSADQRNGLVWANWRVYQEVLDYIIQNFIEGLHPAVDWVLNNGLLPEDITWRWSEWGYTGVCAFEASVQHRVDSDFDAGWYAKIECPDGYYAVLPDFNKDSSIDTVVEGYCAMEHWMFFIFHSNVPPEGPQDIYPLDPEGMPNHYVINLTQVPIETLERWLYSIDLVASSNSEQSIPRLVSLNTTGQELLSKLDLQSGDHILNLAGVDLRDYRPEMKDDVMDAIQRQVLGGHLINVVLERGSTRSHRYIGVPPFGKENPDPSVD